MLIEFRHSMSMSNGEEGWYVVINLDDNGRIVESNRWHFAYGQNGRGYRVMGNGYYCDAVARPQTEPTRKVDATVALWRVDCRRLSDANFNWYSLSESPEILVRLRDVLSRHPTVNTTIREELVAALLGG